MIALSRPPNAGGLSPLSSTGQRPLAILKASNQSQTNSQTRRTIRRMMATARRGHTSVSVMSKSGVADRRRGVQVGRALQLEDDRELPGLPLRHNRPHPPGGGPACRRRRDEYDGSAGSLARAAQGLSLPHGRAAARGKRRPGWAVGQWASCLIELGPQRRVRAEGGHRLGSQQAGKVDQAGSGISGLHRCQGRAHRAPTSHDPPTTIRSCPYRRYPSACHLLDPDEEEARRSLRTNDQHARDRPARGESGGAEGADRPGDRRCQRGRYVG